MGASDQLVVSDGALVIRRMRDERDEHERMVRWRNTPHVRVWWDPDDPPMILEASQAEYGPLCRDESSTTACIVEWQSRPVGYLQFYPWSDDPDEATEWGIPADGSAWGLDVFIGEPEMTGRGIGRRAVDTLARYLFDQRRATLVAFLVAKDNARAIRAYEKAGFIKRGSALDTDTRHGQRVESWVMVRRGGL